MNGTIKRIVPERGFGFISESHTGQEFFFHRTGVELPDIFENLREGFAVTFEEGASKGKGPRAERVQAVRGNR